MDPQQKQKVMIGVLVVLILGAGSYYFVFSGDDGPKQVVTTTSDEGPKQRSVDVAPVRERQTTRTSESRDTEEAQVERAERVQEERESDTTRTRRSGGPEKKSKVKQAPAA